MANDRRKDAATAATGASLLATGGALRHGGVHVAYPKAKPKIHALGMLKAGKGKRLFWGGSALGALGLPPLAVGTTHLIRGDVDKADRPVRRVPPGGALSGGAAGAFRRRTQRLPYNPKLARRGTGASLAGGAGLAGSFPGRKSIEAARRAAQPFERFSETAARVSLPETAISRRTKQLHQEQRAAAVRRVMSIGRISKADEDKRRGFWREGLSGTRDALHQRAQSTLQPVPAKLRAAQLGAGGAAGALGSVAARAALGRRGNALKPFVTPIAGGLAATGSVPLTNRMVRRKYPDYEVTAAGVRRRKEVPKRPSSKSSRYQPSQRSFSMDVGKADKDQRYLGARTPYIRQRAAVTAAGHPPFIGPFTSSATAARYAPPGQERKAATRQFAMGSAAGVPIGVAGAYGGAHLAARSKTAEGIATDAIRLKNAAHNKARSLVGLKAKKHAGHGRLTQAVLDSKAGKPFRTKAGAVGGAAGFLGAKMASGGALGQTAITLNQRDQKRYNKLHHIEKAAGPGQTKREKHVLAERKRRSATLSTTGGVLGLTSLGLLAAGRRQPALTAGTIGSGLGGVNALLGARVQRQEAHAIDPVKKAYADRDRIRLRSVRAQPPKRELLYVRSEQSVNDSYKATKHGHSVFRHRPTAMYTFHVSKAMLPWDGPKMAYHKSHGLVRILGYHGKGMFTALRKDDTQIIAHRDSLSFRKDVKKAIGKPLLVATGSGLSNKLHAVSSVARPKSVFGGLDLHLKGTQEGAGYGFRTAHKAGAARGGRLLGLNQPKAGMPKMTALRKADSIPIQGNKREHAQMLRQYGDRGPLPKGLDRDTRMKAYEARYVHHGGDKQNKWSRRATAAEGVKNIGTGVATAGVTGWLASRHLKSAKRIVHAHPKTTHTLESIAGLGAAIGGAGEIAGGVAHRRQASYANSPGGVAASALRRMRANTPEDS